ncbi:MAG: tyrosine-type recombinase/integrase [Phycisphaeraceae bacterium]|nr:tyrosine-type recombinase/integrase [Phycisphaeraceae bacterium]
MASLKKRGGTYYAQWYIGTKQRRVTLKTSSLQVAKERLRKIESRLAAGFDDPLPTRTPIGEIVAAYVRQMRLVKTAKSAQTDVYYLRQMFGPCCPEIEITSRVVTPATTKRPPTPGSTPRDVAPLDAAFIEQVSTAQITEFIGRLVRAKGLAPKTANRYREIVNRLFNWAIRDGRVRLPGDRNPAARVDRYREPAPEIRYLTLRQIDEQLEALEDHRQLQTMVAMYIYAGLRREEALWLTAADVDLHAGARGMIRIRAKTIGDRSWQPKTRVNRAVPISRDLARWLLRYRPTPNPAGLYFPSPHGLPYDPDNLSSDLRTAQERAGLAWTCLHFRHTFGSQLAQKGVSLYKIATLMGNSPEICRKHYAALVPDAMGTDVEFSNSDYLMPDAI